LIEQHGLPRGDLNDALRGTTPAAFHAAQHDHPGGDAWVRQHYDTAQHHYHP
jgi:hypothetical protein